MRTFYAACIALFIAPVTSADTTMEFDAQGDGLPNEIVIKGNKVLMHSSDGEDMVYDASQKNTTMIDHERRGYYVMDPQAMVEGAKAMQSQMQGQTGAGMQQMQQMQQYMQTLLDDPNIPEDQKNMYREEMAKMMGSAGATPVAPAGSMPALAPMRIESTGESRKISGIKCKMFVVSKGDKAMEEVCVASRKAAGLPEEDYATLRSMFAFMREMADQSMAAMGVESGGPEFPDYGGVPVQIKDLDDGSLSTLRNVSTKSVSDSAFSVPAGYRQHDPFQ